MAGQIGFVLVAGGLGERLGFSGIKIALPSETTTGRSYIELYVRSILAIQSEARARLKDPDFESRFAVMTSGDTHAKTVALFEANNNFGLSSSVPLLLLLFALS